MEFPLSHFEEYIDEPNQLRHSYGRRRALMEELDKI